MNDQMSTVTNNLRLRENITYEPRSKFLYSFKIEYSNSGRLSCPGCLLEGKNRFV